MAAAKATSVHQGFLFSFSHDGSYLLAGIDSLRQPTILYKVRTQNAGIRCEGCDSVRAIVSYWWQSTFFKPNLVIFRDCFFVFGTFQDSGSC